MSSCLQETLLLLLLLLVSPLNGIRAIATADGSPRYAEAPQFRNSKGCRNSLSVGGAAHCDPSRVHIAMTLDHAYLRGTIAAVHSILKHTACPDLVFFHFIVAAGPSTAGDVIRSSFPSLGFKIYPFAESRVAGLISSSSRAALENPLNYARNYLADLFDPCVRRVIYLDSDVIVVDDIRRLWDGSGKGKGVIAAPEYCSADFGRYFAAAFWEGAGEGVFSERRRAPCYFNTGVMVMDLARWRAGGYTERIEGWMRVQRRRRIYELGSLPPFLLVFAGEVEAVDHRWNQHGLGGDNESGSCRRLHPGDVSLLHWSGKRKPWDRLDAGEPCTVDHLWAPYDLYLPPPKVLQIPNRSLI